MNIKTRVKYSFIIILIIIAFVGLINSILLFQINENNQVKKDIDQLVYVQENMHQLLKDISTITKEEQLKNIKNRFLEFEKTFEIIEQKYINSEKKDLIDFFIQDMQDNVLIHKSLNTFFSNEIIIENNFFKTYDLQNKYLKLQKEFNTIYPKENQIRKEIGRKIDILHDYEIYKLYANIKYYSKETLYQYKDKRTLNIWIEKIKMLQNRYDSSLLKEYLTVVEQIGNITIQIKANDDAKKQLQNNSIQIITKNKRLSSQISNTIENITTEFIKSAYSSILILIVLVFFFILFFAYKVYKNVGLSVDEIEHKVQTGLKEIKQLNEEIENTQKEVVFTMGAIGETRSKETGNHVKRVAEYSKIFALHYGLPKNEAELLKQASPMHDIGKVGIPDAILNKPGRFDENERKIMNTHASIGYDMLKHSNRSILKTAAIVAYQHHEKWDGTGYPNGLKGEQIHIYGRITAIADVFDALGSDRCYKKAWDEERIFKLFKEERGKHFDPKLVDIFFEHLDEFKNIREKFKD